MVRYTFYYYQIPICPRKVRQDIMVLDILSRHEIHVDLPELDETLQLKK